MRVDALRHAVLVSACFAGPLLAQEPAKPQPLASAPAVEKTDAGAQPPLIPEVSLQGVPFSDVLNYLRDVDPTFQAIVSAAPDVPLEGPVIQDLRLKNVSSESVLQLLAATYPQIELERADSADVWIIRLNPDPRDTRDAAAKTNLAKRYTSVYSLREIVDHATEYAEDKDEAKVRKEAIDAILSLVQSAVETQGEAKSEVSIKLHQPTETLVFKGTAEQDSLVQQALESLKPLEDDADDQAKRQAAAFKDQARQMEQRHAEQSQRLEERLREMDQERRQATLEARKLSAEVERLQIRLEEAKKSAGASSASPPASAQPEPSQPKQ